MSRTLRLAAIVALAGLAALCAPTAGRAQDGPGPGGPGMGRHGGEDRGDRAGGRVTAIGDHMITVSRRDGTSTTIAVTDATHFRRNGSDAKLSDFKSGDFVFAHGSKDANGQFVATDIMGGDKRPEGRPQQPN